MLSRLEGQGSGHTVGRGEAQERKQGRRYIIRTGNTVRRPRTNGAVAVGETQLLAPAAEVCSGGKRK